ncbi:prolipoprotein diacylglyceryl transferase [Sulfurimonas sp. HSL3-7]|uniref:prolipoprotein diacylglyceryl transferase n=1 Tax=Sulfonitrofixus jiaomeiensis TaxID=3131938 RepID=UPI0031F8A571
MEYWNNIYEQFNPVAFTLFSFPVHWYGMMYVLALVSALYIAKRMVRRDRLAIEQSQLDDYFIYIEIGIILGARLGYILFYDPNTSYYLSHPWQMFNPFSKEGEFVGIRGMSYHGAIIGWFLGSLYYHRRHPEVSFGIIMDVVALAVPVGYMFGRIGNFLNKELIGRTTDLPWGIYVDGVLRHPSQIYEAILEGLVVFLVIYLYRSHKRFNGELILLYGFAYGLMRFTAEFWRQPDVQLGFLFGEWLTMGQLLSFGMMVTAMVLWFYFNGRLAKKR